MAYGTTEQKIELMPAISQLFLILIKMIKADVRGLIKTENISLIKKPLSHLTSLIYFIITLFGHCLSHCTPHFLSLKKRYSNIHSGFVAV